MKLIVAVIRPEKLEAVQRALNERDVYLMTVSDVRGCGRQRGFTEQYRGTEFRVNLLPKLKLEIAVNDAFVEAAIEAIVHSHLLEPPAASEQDRVACENLGLPFLIISLATGTHTVIEPVGYRAPLVGRKWGYGTHDCWSLVRDALRDYAGIVTPDFSRNQWQWWQKGEDLIVERFRAAGFHRVQQGTPPQHLDVFGMQIQSPVVNHLGIFLAPDVMLHQMQDKLSTREIYGGIYQKATVLHLRHERMADAAGH